MANAAARGLRRGRGRKAAEPETEEQFPLDATMDSLASDTENGYDGDNTENTTNTETEGNTMSVDTFQEHQTDTGEEQAPETPTVDYAAMIEDAPADYTPPRASAGRKREPSPFDDLLPKVKDQGYKRIPFDGTDEAAKEIKRQLQKAQHFHGLGMDSAVTQVVGDGENGVPVGETKHYVEFRVRDLQKREKSAAKAGGEGGQSALDANAEANGEDVSQSDDRDE